MNALLICPAARPSVAWLSRVAPLSALPLLGHSLVEYWLSYLAERRIRKVLVLADDRPQRVRHLLGDGARWGISAQVKAEPCELTPARALLKHAVSLNGISEPPLATLLDHFPEQTALFNSYSDWFQGLIKWMPKARTPDRVGVHEVRPGVWVCLPSHVSARAELRPPCWIGKHVIVGKDAIIGPNAIVEDGSFIEPLAKITESWVGPETLVGQSAELNSMLAWADSLLDWQTGTATPVEDEVLLSPLRPQIMAREPSPFESADPLALEAKNQVRWFWRSLLKPGH